MARIRKTPVYLFCGQETAIAIYKDNSRPIFGDTFEGWRYKEHECDEGKKYFQKVMTLPLA